LIISSRKNELKLYTNLRVDVSEVGVGSMTLPDPDLVSDAERDRFTAYHSAIMKSFADKTPETDLSASLPRSSGGTERPL